MARTQQTILNEKHWPIYVLVEPWPQCFELMPKEELTLIWNAPETGDAVQIELLSDKEIVVWPEGEIDDIEHLIDGLPAKDRSWDFKHFVPAEPKQVGLWSAIQRLLG